MAKGMTRKEKAALIARINSGDGGLRALPMLAVPIERAAIDEETRAIPLSFSSETPVERWWGTEILDHTAKAVDLSRLKPNALGPVLFNHDMDKQIGVVVEAEIDEQRKKCKGTIRLSKNGDLANEIWADIIDGIRGNVSIGYEIQDIVLEEEKKGESPSYRVTKWAIYEVSIVSVPADTRVGVGRSMALDPAPQAAVAGREEGIMPPESEVRTVAAAPEPAPVVTPTITVEDVRKKELERAKEIRAMGEQWAKVGGRELAETFVANGKSVEEFTRALLDHLEKKGAIGKAESPDVGLNAKDTKRFSLWNLIRHIAVPDNREWAEAAGFEQEVCRAYMDKNRVTSRGEGMVIPGEILRRAMPVKQTRASDLISGTGSLGGYTVQTDVLGASFVDMLRANAATMGMGTVLSGLTGNVVIPKKTAGSTAYWVAENVAPTDSTLTFDQINPTLKHVGTYIDISRLLFIQSSLDIESIVTQDIADSIAQAIDTVAIKGGGAGEPSGILTLPSGIGDITIGTNGGLGTWAIVLAFEATTGAANAIRPNGMAWLLNSKTVGSWRSIMRTATYGDVPILDDLRAGPKELLGYPYVVDNNVPSTLTKGSSSGICSAAIFGYWPDLVFFLWDGLDVLRDPYTASAAGTVRIRALQTMNLALRNPASFTVCDELLTTGF